VNLVSLAVIAAMAARAPEPGDPLERARQAYEDERFGDAARALEEAYAADPAPELLYARAQALRLSGDCPAALELYDAFLASEPPAEAAADAKANRARCAEATAEVPPPTVEEPPAPPDRPSPARRWYADPWGGALTGAGVAATVTGAVLLANAHARADRARDSQDDATYLRELGSAPTISRVGIGVVAAGGALLTAGIVRYAVLAHRGRKARTQLGLGPGSAIVHIRW